MPKAVVLDPTVGANQSVGSYDQTKYSLLGRVVNNTISSKAVVGPNRGLFFDSTTDAGITPIYTQTTANGRHFELQSISGGIAQIAMWTITGLNSAGTARTKTYVGKIQIIFPNSAATTHTVRGIAVNDNNASRIRIAIQTTGSVLINGGIFFVDNLTAADFVAVPTTIHFGTGSGQKRTYFLQDSALVGVNNNQTVGNGIDWDLTNDRLYFHTGAFNAAFAGYYDTSGTPNVPGQTFTVTIASPGVVTATGHGFNNNDQVALYTTGALPTGLTASVDGTSQTVFFVRNAAANTFELSATTGGASINTTGTQSGVHTVRRAFGITTALALVKTGTIATANSGTLYTRTNSYSIGTPTTGPNSGSLCLFYATDTRLVHFKLSDITGGATTISTMQEVNTVGAVGDTLQTLTPGFCRWSDTIAGFVYYVNDRIFVKRFDNNVVLAKYGCRSNQYLLGLADPTPKLGMSTTNSLDMSLGWVFLSSGIAGQVGAVAFDLYSDTTWSTSRLITPVINIDGEAMNWIAAAGDLPKTEGAFKFYYRTSDFSSATLSWVSADGDGAIPSVTATQIQFMVEFQLDSQMPQTERLFAVSQPANEVSEYWEYVKDQSISTSSPNRDVWRLKQTYSTSVPTLYQRWNDSTGKAGSNLGNVNTASSPSSFEYSTDNGMTWLPLGTIPNTYGTLVRYTYSSPPGVDVRPSIRES